MQYTAFEGDTVRPIAPWLCIVMLVAGCTQWEGGTGGDDDSQPPGDDDATAGDDDTANACGDPFPAEEGEGDESCTSSEPYEQFDPQMELVWQWTDPVDQPEHYQVLSMPVVIDLTDDNGDGTIGSGDVPDVVFITMANECYDCDGVLRAVSGADGTELWNDASGYQLPSGFAPAAAELIASSPGPEIIAMSESEEFLCYSADGQVLWTTPSPESTGSGAISLHDMDHDGEPEIIYGRVIMSPEGVIHGIGEYGYGVTHGQFPVSYAVDIDGDQILEVLVGNAAYHKDGSVLWYNSYNNYKYKKCRIPL